MSKQKFAAMKEPPKPQPSAWEHRCSSCGASWVKLDGHALAHPMLMKHRRVRVALWGHEWAAVAFMAMAKHDQESWRARDMTPEQELALWQAWADRAIGLRNKS